MFYVHATCLLPLDLVTDLFSSPQYYSHQGSLYQASTDSDLPHNWQPVLTTFATCCLMTWSLLASASWNSPPNGSSLLALLVLLLPVIVLFLNSRCFLVAFGLLPATHCCFYCSGIFFLCSCTVYYYYWINVIAKKLKSTLSLHWITI